MVQPGKSQSVEISWQAIELCTAKRREGARDEFRQGMNLEEREKFWFRDLDSNQDTQLQRLMSYQLDDPGTDYKKCSRGAQAFTDRLALVRMPSALPASENPGFLLN